MNYCNSNLFLFFLKILFKYFYCTSVKIIILNYLNFSVSLFVKFNASAIIRNLCLFLILNVYV